jgi:flagellar motor protein MotB
MAKHEEKKAQEEEGGGESAPLWIISFADMISLLMAFFVMLSTFNSFDKTEKKKLDAAIEATLTPSGGWYKETPKNSMGWKYQDSGETEGSSRPTLERPKKSGPINQTSSRDFYRYKVFLVPASTLFFTTGNVLTPEGRKWLDTLAEYLGKMPGGVVISGQGPDQPCDQSINRSLSVVNYLSTKGIQPERLNVSSRGTLPKSHFQKQSMLEVCLLDTSKP